MLFFLAKKTRIYVLHMRNRFKKGHDLGSRWQLKKVFLFRKARSFCKVRIRLMKLYLLHLLNLLQRQHNTLYMHHHSVVIVILLDIGDCNAPIAIAISFLILMHFFGVEIGHYFIVIAVGGPAARVARSLVDYVSRP